MTPLPDGAPLVPLRARLLFGWPWTRGHWCGAPRQDNAYLSRFPRAGPSVARHALAAPHRSSLRLLAVWAASQAAGGAGPQPRAARPARGVESPLPGRGLSASGAARQGEAAPRRSGVGCDVYPPAGEKAAPASCGDGVNQLELGPREPLGAGAQALVRLSPHGRPWRPSPAPGADRLRPRRRRTAWVSDQKGNLVPSILDVEISAPPARRGAGAARVPPLKTVEDRRLPRRPPSDALAVRAPAHPALETRLPARGLPLASLQTSAHLMVVPTDTAAPRLRSAEVSDGSATENDLPPPISFAAQREHLTRCTPGGPHARRRVGCPGSRWSTRSPPSALPAGSRGAGRRRFGLAGAWLTGFGWAERGGLRRRASLLTVSTSGSACGAIRARAAELSTASPCSR
jgi:hypothetical protein